MKYKKAIVKKACNLIEHFKRNWRGVIVAFTLSLANSILPYVVKPSNIQDTVINTTKPISIKFLRFEDYNPQPGYTHLSERSLENAFSIDTNHNFSDTSKKKVLGLLRNLSRKPLNTLSIHESVELTSRTTASLLSYDYDSYRNSKHGGRIPDKSIENVLQTKKGVCHNYAEFTVAVFNILKEQNKNLSNTYFSYCVGNVNCSGWIPRKIANLIGLSSDVHAWNRIITVSDKDKVYVTYIDPTWTDTKVGPFDLSNLLLNAYNRVHEPASYYIDNIVERLCNPDLVNCYKKKSNIYEDIVRTMKTDDN